MFNAVTEETAIGVTGYRREYNNNIGNKSDRGDSMQTV
jgi:hypothetical protein